MALKQLEALGASLMELSLDVAKHNIRDSRRTSLRKEIYSLSEATLLQAFNVSLHSNDAAVKIHLMRSLLGWIELVLDRCSHHGFNIDRLIGRVCRKRLSQLSRQSNNTTYNDTIQHNNSGDNSIALMWTIGQSLEQMQETQNNIQNTIDFLIGMHYCYLYNTLCSEGVAANVVLDGWDSANDFFEFCNRLFRKLKIKQKSNFFVKACAKVLEAIVVESERGQTASLSCFTDLSLKITMLSISLGSSFAKAKSSPRNFTPFALSPDSKSLDSVWRASLEGLLSRMLQDSDEVGLKALETTNTILKQLNTILSNTSTPNELPLETTLGLCTVLTKTLSQQLTTTPHSTTADYNFIKLIVLYLLECLNRLCGLWSLLYSNKQRQRVASSVVSLEGRFLQGRKQKEMDWNRNAASVLLPVAGEIFKLTAQFTSKGQPKEKVEFWLRMGKLMFEIFGSSENHWSVLFKGASSLWAPDSAVSNLHTASAVLRTALPLTYQDTEQHKSILNVGVRTALAALVDLLPDEDADECSVEINGEYTILTFAARIIVLYCKSNRHVDTLLLKYCRRAASLTHRFELPPELLLQYTTACCVMLGSSEDSENASLCFLALLKYQDTANNYLNQMLLRILEVLHFLLTQGELPTWATQVHDIDSEPSPMSKIHFEDLMVAFENTTHSRAPVSTKWNTKYNARKALKAAEQVLEGLQHKLRTAFLPFQETSSSPTAKRISFTQHKETLRKKREETRLVARESSLKDSGVVVDFVESCVSLCRDFESLWKWRREWRGSGSAGATGQVCIALESLISLASEYGTVRGSIIAAHYSLLSAVLAKMGGDLWESANCFSRAASLLRITKRNNISDNMIQYASECLASLGAVVEQKRLLIQYVKPEYNTQNTIQYNNASDGSVGSFYFLLGVGEELSVVRMVRKKEQDGVQYNITESELIERIQKDIGLRYSQGCIRWRSRQVWKPHTTSTLPTQQCCVSFAFRENATSLATAKQYNTILNLESVGKTLRTGSFWLRRLWPIELKKTTHETQQNTIHQHNRCPTAFVLLPYAQDDSQYTEKWKRSSPTRHNTSETLTGILTLDKLVFTTQDSSALENNTTGQLTQYKAQVRVQAEVMKSDWVLYDVLCESKYGLPIDEDGELIGPQSNVASPKDTDVEIIGPPPTHPPPPLEPPPVDMLENQNFMPPVPPSLDSLSIETSSTSPSLTNNTTTQHSSPKQQQLHATLETPETPLSVKSPAPPVLPPPLAPDLDNIPPPPLVPPPPPPTTYQVKERNFKNPLLEEKVVVMDDSVTQQALLESSTARLKGLAGQSAVYSTYNGVRVSSQDLAQVHSYQRQGSARFQGIMLEPRGVKQVQINCSNKVLEVRDALGASLSQFQASDIELRESSTPGAVVVKGRKSSLLLKVENPSLFMCTMNTLSKV